MSVGMIVDTVGGRMPKCCDGCDLEEWNHNAMEYTCVLNEYDLRTPEERSKSIGDWCPLQEVEPVRHGHWKALRGDWDGLYECQECGSRFGTPYYYCPVCGVKMDCVDGGAE